MDANSKKGNALIIYDFMVDELKLSGVPLIVYALIYSFTSYKGSLYSTREYLAKRAGCTVKSVDRTLKKLVKQGLVKKISRPHTSNVYTANPIKSEKVSSIAAATFCPPESGHFEESGSTFCPPQEDILSPKEKEKRNNITTTSTTYESDDEAENSLPTLPTMRRFGASGLVVMTGEQHARLCDLLGDDIAENYIYQVEAYLAANPSMYLKNHYRTILQWVKEDSSC